MKSTTSIGRRGEDIAASWLSAHGYVILTRNYRRRFGEIDIVARQDDCLVFIEVKTRSSRKFGAPLDAVTFKKQQQLSLIAGDYLVRHNMTDMLCRFDVVSVTLAAGRSPKVDIIVNAFEAF